MEKKVISVIKAIFVDLLIVVAIMFIYPLESIIMSIGMSIFSNSSSDKDLIKGFGNVRIENYKKYEKIESDDVYVDCYAIYFNEKQSNAIESQINSDENWTKKPFNEKIINKYKKVNVNNFENSYYYLIEFDKNYNAIETNREILDNKPIEWYKSAIYDSDNKTLYYYYRHYEK